MWEAAPEAMRSALARHDEIVQAAIGAHRGVVFSTGGDGFAAAFTRAGDALAAASDAQGALGAEPGRTGRGSGRGWACTPVRSKNATGTTSVRK